MVNTGIQYSCPVMVYSKFVENINFDNQKNKNVKMETKVDVQKRKIQDNEYAVSVDIKVGEESDDFPFYVETKYEAGFRWNEEVTEEQREKFLSTNAPAIIYSYARPMVATLTNSSRYMAFNIPIMNFTK